MKILYINNHGGGFADHIEVPEGTTVLQLFEQKMGGCRAEDYLIRVDRLPASARQVLQPDSRVSITPVKIEGAGGSLPSR
jgi:hypothetical protein